jgi:hypothetical protein
MLLALDNRDVDLDLIEPTGVNRSKYVGQVTTAVRLLSHNAVKKFAAARIPQPHPERRDSSRGFSPEPVPAPSRTPKAIASRHLPWRSRDEEEYL